MIPGLGTLHGAVFDDDEQRGGGRANNVYVHRSRQMTDTARPLNFQEDDERGVCEKLIRFESFLHLPLRILPAFHIVNCRVFCTSLRLTRAIFPLLAKRFARDL